MKGWEALKALQEGKKIRAHGWLSDDFIYLEGVLLKSQLGLGLIPSYIILQSLIGDKWEIVE